MVLGSNLMFHDEQSEETRSQSAMDGLASIIATGGLVLSLLICALYVYVVSYDGSLDLGVATVSSGRRTNGKVPVWTYSVGEVNIRSTRSRLMKQISSAWLMYAQEYAEDVSGTSALDATPFDSIWTWPPEAPSGQWSPLPPVNSPVTCSLAPGHPLHGELFTCWLCGQPTTAPRVSLPSAD